MKSITDFNSDGDYYDYLTVYFAGLAMQTRMAICGANFSKELSRQHLSIECVNDAMCLVEQLKKIKK